MHMVWKVYNCYMRMFWLNIDTKPDSYGTINDDTKFAYYALCAL